MATTTMYKQATEKFVWMKIRKISATGVKSAQLHGGNVDSKMALEETAVTIGCCVISIMKTTTIDALNMAQLLRRRNNHIPLAE